MGHSRLNHQRRQLLSFFFQDPGIDSNVRPSFFFSSLSPGSDTSPRPRESLNQFQSRVIKTEKQLQRINLLIITSKKRQKSYKKRPFEEGYKVKDKHFVGFLTQKTSQISDEKLSVSEEKKLSLSVE